MIINGKQIAQEILDNLKEKVNKQSLSPTLAVILIGEDPASIAYIKQKQKAADYIGAKVNNINLPKDIEPKEIVKIIEILNKDRETQGIITQLPFPKHIYPKSVQLAIDPRKDVDGFLPTSSFTPPVAMAVLKVLGEIKKLESKLLIRNAKFLVIGRGTTAGKPIAETLTENGFNVTVAHSQTRDLKSAIGSADIIISCVGKPNIVKAKDIKPGSILIGVGIGRTQDGKLTGDYDEEEISKVTSYYTPTPGGIGPINVACLMENLVKAAYE